MLQHAHIYRIHTLHFIFGEIFFLKFLSIQPLLVESETIVNIKVEPGTEVPLPAKRFNDICVHVKDLAESIHSDQTGAFR